MLPSIKINVWPTNNAGKVKAMVKVTFGDKISVYPIKIIEGKDGLFLGMPQVPDKNGAYKDVFHPNSKEARESLTEMVMKTYYPQKSTYAEYPSEEEIVLGANVNLYDNEESDLIGFAGIDINDDFRMERIRIFHFSKQIGKTIYFPARGYLEDGKTVTKEIFEFQGNTEEHLKQMISETYDAAFQARSEIRIRKAMSSRNYPTELNLDELMELKRRMEFEAKKANREIQEPEECVSLEDELVL